ncbi:MAG TPA: glucoamylase family protein [Kofleriaceae bacterium]|nr:glucoamylase family protein [Kofleriaceae bacterium]
MRAELFSVSQLEQHARALASRREVARTRQGDRLLPRLADNETALRDAYGLVARAVTLGRRITPAAEWFIDNYHLIEEQVRTTRRHLPRAYDRELPRLTSGRAAGMPRVYEIALELISHSQGRVDRDSLRAFVSAYQEVRPLGLGELWAIPIMLRLALIENLRRVVSSVIAGRTDRERAALWADRMIETAASEPAKVVVVLADMVAADPRLSNAFVNEFATRLQGQGPALVFPITWLEQRLAERGEGIEHVFQLVSQSQAADQVAVSNSIASQRFIDATDWRDFVEASSVVERTLAEDPAGVYARMDFATRDAYRHVVEAIARRSGRAEQEVARAAVALAGAADGGRAAHVGYYLLDDGQRSLERAVGMRRAPLLATKRLLWRSRTLVYFAAVALVTGGVTALLAAGLPTATLPAWMTATIVALLLIGNSQLAIAVVHWAATLLVRPRIMPRLDFSRGIPPEQRTLVAVPTLLRDVRETDELLEALEVRHLANPDAQLAFALVTDFRDAAAEHQDGDDALLRHAVDGIAALNARHTRPGRDAPFHLLHRPRRWNPREGVWMGWERKRGKLEELNAALRGDASGFTTIAGDLARLQGVAYVIALDSDTDLPRDAARQLAATMAHPLVRPRFDPARGRVVEGHAILQPRVSVTMVSARATRFAGLFGGEPGIDPYTRAVSDVYQDLFDEGSFIGKGIYDVDAFRQATAGRLPENRVLSHDLLEGALARAGLVSDLLLFEDYPSSYAADVSRRRRWMRGDWQIAAWLRRRVPAAGQRRARNPLTLLSQWKILDNLRRSLVPIALLALLAGGWLVPGVGPLATAAVAAIIVLPGLLAAGASLARRPADVPRHFHGREVGKSLTRQVLRDLFALACLPYDAAIGVTEILRTAWRLLITRRRLLEWRTAADAERSGRTHLAGAYRSMWTAPVAAVAVAVALQLRHPDAIPLAAPLLALWLVAPALTWWLSRPLARRPHRLGADDVAFLRGVARRTWRFFETFVGAEDNHLPPDNVQEDPPVGPAHRTSPTNIGLCLTANLAAYDFGYLSPGDLIERSTLTLDSLDRLPRYRGHFYNWYDTRTLEPLRPMYVSAVDSGNLAGHLLTLAAGLQELAAAPLPRPQVVTGLADTLLVMADLEGAPAAWRAATARLGAELGSPPATPSAARALLARVIAGVDEHLRPLVGADEELRWWTDALQTQARRALDDLLHLAPWLELDGASPAPAALDRAMTLAQIAALEQTPSSGEASSRAAARLSRLGELATRCRELADLDYDFLYDRERQLLAIGYNVSDHRLDASFYDLLASEARLASFIAIAQGKLPQEHWFSLGRLLTTSAGKPALLSWSGSMFEYLMPLLVMPTYEGTILDETYRGVVDRQIAYGRERRVPWGVSESGYLKTDAHLNYQYRAFGVPGLGFKRGLGDDLVITPYASALALMVDPEASCENLARLARDGQLGPYGFYEAIDYTAARVPRGKTHATVRSFMAHHQGMSFLALAYVLLDRPMQRRFASDPAFRATELLLQERVPRTPAIFPHPAEVSAVAASGGEQNLRVFTTPSTSAPAVQLLSNGNYHVAVTNAGGGYSRWRELAVTRWHEDPTSDAWGSFCYLRDVTDDDDGAFWSVAHQPTRAGASQYEAVFSLGRAEFRRRDGEIDCHVEISVSPEDDVELRRVSLTNVGRTARTIEVTSYAEVVLAPAAADAAHPAFSNLFVQTELLRPRQAILCTRRPRSGGESPPWLLHLMTAHGAQSGETSYETARGEFIGRGRQAADPAAMHRAALSDSEGSVLDPVVAIRQRVVIEPDGTATIHLFTGVSETRDGALALIEKYSDRPSADRLLELSWTHNQVLLRRLDATEADTQLYERLVSNILYANPAMRAPRSIIARNRSGQSALWAYSISGDLPIALVRIATVDHIALVRQMVQAHAYWRLKGVAADLVIWNEDPSGYRQVLQDEIMAVIASRGDAGLLDKPGGIYVCRSEQLSEQDKILMQTVARLIVRDQDGSLAEQMNRRVPPEAQAPPFEAQESGPREQNGAAADVAYERPDLAGWNGYGGFTRDGREYVIVTNAGARTPAPWVNVLANPHFGTVVSESGGAYTWCENARSYRLTPWHNDPVSDASGEAFYLRDEDDGRFWSPTLSPAGGRHAYTTRHGFGYTVFEVEADGVASEVHTYVATDAPIKFTVLRLRNRSGRTRRLSVTAYCELVLGETRPVNRPHVVTEVDPASGALLARNAYSSEFAPRVAFMDCSEEERSFSADRGEVIGRNGSMARPAFMTRARLSGRVGAGLDACLAMQATVEIGDGEEREVAFTFGSGRDLDDARTLVQRFRGTGAARAALEQVWDYWNRTLGAVNVQTPDASLNYLANGWLLYQVLASRMWGRSGFYQSGGAFGFRDQLQDAMALVHAEPALLREQILRSAARQFREGDVQHWWHPPMGRGVRTRISDDYLFLPAAVCRYVTAIGDTGVLDEKVPYIEGRTVKPDEDSYYDLPLRSEDWGTVYDHCVRAIVHGLRFGAHGLPLMGSGDWNDGMNLVGDEGKGESVWLAFFLHDVLVRFVEVARARQDVAFADRCVAEAKRLRGAIEQHAWDGAWYRRAYFDGGEPLGSSSSPECQIDSLPQSWAVLSGAGAPERARQGLESLDQRLVRRDLRLIQLFDPPFDRSELEPGYIKGYVPGVRENGGQYTHAAVWAVMAFAAAGDVARAWELFDLINPARHGDDEQSIGVYQVEPYVVAADVYTNPQHAGRGGWTWYTGSAGWMYRLVLESLLGVRIEVDRLRVEPLMPPSWESFDVHYRHRNTVHHIHVRNLGGGGRIVRRVVFDGVEQPERTVPLRDDGVEHHCQVDVGGDDPPAG